MPEAILCKICGKRRARRACPAVQGDICTICCGTEREVSLSCPLECQYLQEAHRHEKPIALSENRIPDPDIEVSEEFLHEQQELLLFSMHSLAQAALRTPGAVDTDVLDALEALIKTQRTAESGLLYQTQSENSIAAAVQRRFSDALAEYRKQRAEREPLKPVRDSEMLKILAFLRRFGLRSLNGRARGRMYLDLLRQMTPAADVDERAPSIIL